MRRRSLISIGLILLIFVSPAQSAGQSAEIQWQARRADLFRAAVTYPGIYRRIEWWDKAAGLLPNPDVRYPQLSRPAAFACADNTCSLPVFQPSGIAKIVERLMAAQ